MKKLRIFGIILFSLFLSACSNEFAKREYDSDEKIAQSEDRYAEEVFTAGPIDGGYSLTVSKFNGRETIWTENVEKDQTMDIDFSFRLSKGRAKIVHIDSDDHVTTVIECEPNTPTDGFEPKQIALKKGRNRLKIVGYGCEDIDLKMLYEKPEREMTPGA